MNELKNVGVLITRPKPQGEILCDKIAAVGGRPIYFPVMDFVPLQPVSMPKEYDWLIFISPRAVEYGLRAFPNIRRDAAIAALGRGTAQALETAGFKNVIYPLENWTSEGLAEQAEFQALSGKQVILVCGEGGRETLAAILASRGARVLRLEVYRRILPVYDNIEAYLNLLRQKKIEIVVCTSYESLHNLLSLIGQEHQSMLKKLNLVVVSERLVSLAHSLGFEKTVLAKNASDSKILDALSSIKRK